MSQAGTILAGGGGGGGVTSVTGANGVSAAPTTGAVVVSGINATTTTVGVASFNGTNFTVSGAGAVSSNPITILGAGGITITGSPVNLGGTVTITGPTITPTTYTENTGTATPAANNLNVLGTFIAAAVSPVSTLGSGSTITVQVQLASQQAASSALNAGLASFNSTNFVVNGNGYVSLNGATIGQTITGDSGGALSPTAGNWNILGRSGSKTSGSGSSLTIKSPPYTDQGGSTTVTLNSGSSVTAAITLTLPASAGLADGDLFEFYCTTAGALVIQAVGAQKIRIGSLISSAAGTATSTNIGDSVSLRFRAADGFFYATSVIGTFLLA
jgi:hypothetical protein